MPVTLKIGLLFCCLLHWSIFPQYESEAKKTTRKFTHTVRFNFTSSSIRVNFFETFKYLDEVKLIRHFLFDNITSQYRLITSNFISIFSTRIRIGKERSFVRIGNNEKIGTSPTRYTTAGLCNNIR